MGNIAVSERKKYETVWKHDAYRNFSPGEMVAPLFKRFAKKRGKVLDIGCGTGRAGLELSKRHHVTLMDFAENAPEVKLPFIKQNLWTRWPKETWDYGYCCDVMEHIPPDKVDKVLTNIFKHCDKVFFSISFTEDHFGSVVGHPLHLTVEDFNWWLDKLGEYRDVKDARDLIGMGTFYCV